MNSRFNSLLDEAFGVPARERKAKADAEVKKVADEKAAADSTKKAADVESKIAELQKKIHARERVLRQEAGARRKKEIDAAMVSIQNQRASRGKRTLDEAALRSKAARRVQEGGE